MMELFRHPGLAALGAALIAVPIIIHLLNRRRFRVVRWGAMSFLLAAYKKTRRRLELENLLLLLLRALAVALLGLAVARPMLSPQSPLANVVGARRDVVIALDASYSMAYRDGATTSYERGLASARAVLEQLKPERNDRATLILAKQRPLRLSASSLSSARDALARAPEPTFESIDLPATLELVAREVDAFAPEGGAPASPTGAVFCFITDLQRSTFFPRDKASGDATDAAPKTPGAAAGGAAPASPLQTAIAALATRKVAIRIIDVGPPGDGAVENAGIADVPPPEDMPATGVPVEMRATIRNFGAAPRNGVVVTPTVDGNREPTQTIDVPPGESRSVALSLLFRDPGDHAVEVAIDDDKLAVDDRRACALHVRPPIRVLLVDGSPAGADFETTSAGMLQLVLSPPEEANAVSPFQLVGGQAVPRATFASRAELLDQADLVILANVEGLSEDQSNRLREFVTAGGGLLIFLGDQVDATSYSTRLRAGNDPKQWWLPAGIGAVKALPSRESRPWRIAHVPDPLPPQLRFFQPPERRVLLTEVPIFAFMSVDVSDDDVKAGSEVLARYDDPDQSPFLVTKAFGQGRVALVTTSLDPSNQTRWNRIAESVKTLVPLVFDLIQATAGGDDASQNVLVGQPIRARVHGFPRKAAVIDPTGRREELNVDTAKPLGSERYQLPDYTSTQRPGLYAMELETAGGVGATSSSKLTFAVGVDPAEGDLTRIPAASVLSAFPAGADVRVQPTLEEETAPPVEGNSSEIWKALIAGALGVLVLESALATWFGRRRS